MVGELADSSVNFFVRPWVKNADYWDVKWDITERVKLAFDDNGISIPYPQMDVHVQNCPRAHSHSSADVNSLSIDQAKGETHGFQSS